MISLIIPTNWPIPARFAALTVAFVVFIRPEYRNDAGLIAHELTHVRQFWRWLGLNGLLYKFSKKWRTRFEVEAYRKQLEFSPHALEHFAVSLSTKYALNITHDRAIELLKGQP